MLWKINTQSQKVIMCCEVSQIHTRISQTMPLNPFFFPVKKKPSTELRGTIYCVIYTHAIMFHKHLNTIFFFFSSRLVSESNNNKFFVLAHSHDDEAIAMASASWSKGRNLSKSISVKTEKREKNFNSQHKENGKWKRK